MSECSKYEVRQPVEVMRPFGWAKGVVRMVDHDDLSHAFIQYWPTGMNNYSDGESRWFEAGDIRPDPDYRLAPIAEPARTGWRLPEPGDVIVHQRNLHYGEREIKAVQWDRMSPILVEGDPEKEDVRFNLLQIELVRRHDAPEPPSVAPPAPKGRHAKQDIIDNAKLELAAVTLEQDGHDKIALMLRDLKRDWSDAS